MNQDTFDKLDVGDIVRHNRTGGEAYVVTGNYGKRKTAVRTIDLTNAREWQLITVTRPEDFG